MSEDDDWRTQLRRVDEEMKKPRPPRRNNDKPRPTDGGAGGQSTPNRNALRRVWERQNPRRRVPNED